MNKYKLIAVSNPYGRTTSTTNLAFVGTRKEGRDLLRTFGLKGSHLKGTDVFFRPGKENRPDVMVTIERI